MTDPTKDIDALLGYLSICADRYSCHTLPSDVAANYHASLTALVAERDELRAKCKIQHGVINDMIEKQRNDDRDRDLRKDLICAALTGLVANKGLAGGYGEADTMIDDAMWLAGKTIAAMRKGEANGE